jgi:glutaredoxin
MYSTSGCHLCEEARRLVYATLGFPVEEVDIAGDERLLERYGIRIPVLKRTDTGAEIGWPFGPQEVRALVE